MDQSEKELLLKDLCCRLPYGIKVYDAKSNVNVPYMNLCHVNGIINEVFISSGMICRTAPIEDIKPYLFPLSSMTEEQKREISKRYNYHNYYGLSIEITYHSEGYWDDDNSCNLQDYLWLEDWYNKNHFDYRGLIEKGLAIDATNKNIY